MPAVYAVFGAQAAARATLLDAVEVADALGLSATAVPSGRSIAPAAIRSFADLYFIWCSTSIGRMGRGGTTGRMYGADVPPKPGQ
ncbi:hypothetical protein Skr01_63700 [Sphaerisporangium krabiense]|nr:hypothetical protein Skr01_63700 [Sphaerisporangium krabiense]